MVFVPHPLHPGQQPRQLARQASPPTQHYSGLVHRKCIRTNLQFSCSCCNLQFRPVVARPGWQQPGHGESYRQIRQVAHDKFTYFKGHLYPLKRRSLLAEYSIQKFGTISRKGDRHQIFRGLTGRISLKRGRANPLLAEELGAKPPLCSGACASLPPNLP